MKKQPFFSIPIATYNRAVELEFAIKRILAQDFKDFELIISDDNSSDATEKTVLKFKDQRIRYYKNKVNLGAVPNIQEVLTHVKGKYIFMHGDDDFLLYDNVLRSSHNLLVEKKLGLLRLNYLYQSSDKLDVYDFFRYKNMHKNLYLGLGKSKEALKFIEKVDLYFISGIIFKNPYPAKIVLTDSELIPWFSVCYKALLRYGGYFSKDHQVIASWSYQKNNPVFFVRNGKLTFESFYDELKKYSDEKYYKKELSRQLHVSVINLPTIKYNSNNTNLINYARRIIELNPVYKTSPKFWIMLSIGYVLPKFVLKGIRAIYIARLKKLGKPNEYKRIRARIRNLRNRQ